jgi:ABC-type transporter Mla MlaB component/DNA-directed RNA polymerase subunit RPC12/RpoP
VKVGLRWNIVRRPEQTEVALLNPLDEWTDFDKLFEELPRDKLLRMDLAQVSRISSAGVRNWILFVDKLREQKMAVQLEGCSVAIVRQMSMISRFRGHGVVRSAYAPYYCTRCNKEQLRLIDLTTDISTQLHKPLPCPTCGNLLDLDEEEQLYTELQLESARG